MTTLIIDTRSVEAKKMLEYLKTQSFVQIVDDNEQSTYNPEFVAKIQESRASKGKPIRTEDLWK